MVNWRRPSSSGRPAPADPALQRARLLAALLTLLAVGCGHAGDENPVNQVPGTGSGTSNALCVPADEGLLRARLQGAIDVDLDWATGVQHCKGGPRPDGEGVRLIYKGDAPGEGPLLLVLGIGPLRAGESARDVPVNLTIVREGTGRFYSTRGDDKCAMDEVRQEPTGDPQVYRLTGRGYCMQPARAVAGDGAVLVSRFDVMATVDYR